MEILNSISKNFFEAGGMFVGGFACLMIFVQLIREIKLHEKSSISLFAAFGWCMIFTFWVFYGLRLNALAIFYCNIVAAILQILLFIVIMIKNKKFS